MSKRMACHNGFGMETPIQTSGALAGVKKVVLKVV